MFSSQSLQGTGIEFGYKTLGTPVLQPTPVERRRLLQVASPNASFPLFFTLRSFCGRGFCERQTRHRIWFGFGHSPRFSFWLRLPHHQKLPNQLELCLVGSQPCSAGYPVCYSYPPTTSSIQKRAVIGIYRYGGLSDNNYSAFVGSLNGTSYDTRIVVTATIPTEVTVQETSTTIQSTEIKNLSTIKIGFRYSF